MFFNRQKFQIRAYLRLGFQKILISGSILMFTNPSSGRNLKGDIPGHRVNGYLIFYHSGKVFTYDAVKIFKNAFSLKCVTNFRMPLEPIDMLIGKRDRFCITNG
jgi:hypothetical protein